MGKLIVGIAGWPGSGKSILRHLLGEVPGVKAVKWSDAFHRVLEERLGKSPRELGPEAYWDAVRSLTALEEKDPLLVARAFVALHREEKAPVLVAESPKSPEGFRYAAWALDRTPILVWVETPEPLRQRNVAERGDVDDTHDGERRELLRRLGLEELAREASLRIPTGGVWIREEPFEVRFDGAFVGAMDRLADLMGLPPMGREGWEGLAALVHEKRRAQRNP